MRRLAASIRSDLFTQATFLVCFLFLCCSMIFCAVALHLLITMPRHQQGLTVEVVEQMTTEDIAKLSKKMRRKANEMLEKINAKKEAEVKAEQLRLANIEKERRRIEGVEKKRLEKENQTKKDDERHRLMSEEVAKMTQVTATVAITETPKEKQKILPFHKTFANFIATNPSFRNSLSEEDVKMFDKLISMSTAQLAETLLRSGFSFKPRHRTDCIITEIIKRSHREGPSRELIALSGTNNFDEVHKKSSLEDIMFFHLADLIGNGDMKYMRGFLSIGNKNDRVFEVVDNLGKFLVDNGIPWRETRFMDIIEAIEEPEGRLVRLGRYFKEELRTFGHEGLYGGKNRCHHKERYKLNNLSKLAKQNIEEEKSYIGQHWLPLIPEEKEKYYVKFSDEFFVDCSEGI